MASSEENRILEASSEDQSKPRKGAAGRQEPHRKRVKWHKMKSILEHVDEQPPVETVPHLTLQTPMQIVR